MGPHIHSVAHLIESASVAQEVRMHGGEEGLRALVGRDVVQPNVHHERIILVEPDHKVVVAHQYRKEVGFEPHVHLQKHERSVMLDQRHRLSPKIKKTASIKERSATSATQGARMQNTPCSH